MERKRVLYLGLTAPNSTDALEIIHYPIIEIVPRDPRSPDIVETFKQLPNFTHIIFTSKTSVSLFLNWLPYEVDIFQDKCLITVGQQTAKHLHSIKCKQLLIAKEETAEGIIDLLKREDLSKAHVLWPHSELSRPLLSDFMALNHISFRESILYSTQTKKNLKKPNLTQFDQLIFTSPSCVTAFLEVFGSFPREIDLKAIGPITLKILNNHL